MRFNEIMIALYPGSFDPLTLGHVDVVKRFSRFFTKLILLIAESHGKKSFFSLEERKKMASLVFRRSKQIVVDSHSGLTIDYAKKVKAKIILRGLRAISDFEREIAIANVNKALSPNIETLIAPARPEYSFISSKMVKEVASHGGDLSQLVPKGIEKALTQRYLQEKIKVKRERKK